MFCDLLSKNGINTRCSSDIISKVNEAKRIIYKYSENKDLIKEVNVTIINIVKILLRADR